MALNVGFRSYKAGEFTIGCFPVRHRDTDSFGFSFESQARRHLRPERLSACVYRKLKLGRSGDEVRPEWRMN
jgi:hypothetical protein